MFGHEQILSVRRRADFEFTHKIMFSVLMVVQTSSLTISKRAYEKEIMVMVIVSKQILLIELLMGILIH